MYILDICVFKVVFILHSFNHILEVVIIIIIIIFLENSLNFKKLLKVKVKKQNQH